MVFIEAHAFTRLVDDYLTHREYLTLQVRLVLEPHLGVVISGTGGFRKLRLADSRRGKGRRGGLRLIYYYFPEESQIWLLTIYDKDEAKDLTSAEKALLKEALGKELASREAKRKARDKRKKR